MVHRCLAPIEFVDYQSDVKLLRAFPDQSFRQGSIDWVYIFVGGTLGGVVYILWAPAYLFKIAANNWCFFRAKRPNAEWSKQLVSGYRKDKWWFDYVAIWNKVRRRGPSLILRLISTSS